MTNDQPKRPIIFLAVGIFNTLFDFAFYTFLTTVFFKGGNNIALAGFISGTFALICAFLTHGFITWRGRHIGRTTVLKFLLFTGFGMWVLRPILLSLFIKWSGLYQWAYGISESLHLPFSYDFIANTGAFGFMVIIVLIYNYFVYNRYVFSNPKTTTGPSDHTEPESRSES